MNIVFLERAKQDLHWFHEYYVRKFPEGRVNADTNLRNALKILKTHPSIGRPSEQKGIFLLNILRTPFTIAYRKSIKDIEIISVWDTRSQRPTHWTPTEVKN